MSASVAIASSASAVALAAAEEARRAACIAGMRGFQHDPATVEQARAYASCVFTVFGSGDPMPNGMELALKVLFVASMASGVFWSWRFYQHDLGGELPDAIIGFLAGAVGVPVIAGVVGALALGFWWVLA